MVMPVGEDGRDQSLDQVERGLDGRVIKQRLFRSQTGRNSGPVAVRTYE